MLSVLSCRSAVHTQALALSCCSMLQPGYLPALLGAAWSCTQFATAREFCCKCYGMLAAQRQRCASLLFWALSSQDATRQLKPRLEQQSWLLPAPQHSGGMGGPEPPTPVVWQAGWGSIWRKTVLSTRGRALLLPRHMGNAQETCSLKDIWPGTSGLKLSYSRYQVITIGCSDPVSSHHGACNTETIPGMAETWLKTAGSRFETCTGVIK